MSVLSHLNHVSFFYATDNIVLKLLQFLIMTLAYLIFSMKC